VFVTRKVLHEDQSARSTSQAQSKKTAKNKKKAAKKKAKKQGQKTQPPPAPPTPSVRHFKVTLVGLEEFDTARYADTTVANTFCAGHISDQAIDEVIDKIPWPFPKPQHFQYKTSDPVAPTFVDLVTSLLSRSLPASCLEGIEQCVEVVSSAEYLAGLSAERAANENWWTYNIIKMAHEPQPPMGKAE
jgi:hypothetical protein